MKRAPAPPSSSTPAQAHAPAHDLDPALCDALLGRASSGDAEARRDLVEHLWPIWNRMIRASRWMGSLARSDDHVDNVVGSLVEKFSRSDKNTFALHAAWRERHPTKTFKDWLRIVTANAARDYVRGREGATAADGDGHPLPSVKRMLNDFALSAPVGDPAAARPPMTAAQTARQILEFGKDNLPDDQFAALERWLRGSTFEEIRDDLALPDAPAGERLVRAAVAVLRREFVVEI